MYAIRCKFCRIHNFSKAHTDLPNSNGNDRDTLLAIGILNSISAGILIYSALVQIISGDFIHNRGMLHASFSRAIAALTSFTIGALVMVSDF